MRDACAGRTTLSLRQTTRRNSTRSRASAIAPRQNPEEHKVVLPRGSLADPSRQIAYGTTSSPVRPLPVSRPRSRMTSTAQFWPISRSAHRSSCTRKSFSAGSRCGCRTRLTSSRLRPQPAPTPSSGTGGTRSPARCAIHSSQRRTCNVSRSRSTCTNAALMIPCHRCRSWRIRYRCLTVCATRPRQRTWR